MLLRAAATAIFTLLGLSAAAECVGESYIDLMSPDDRARLDAAAADTPFGNGILWSAQKDGRQITVVGTMHIYDSRLEPIRTQVAADVAAADLVLLEATPEDETRLQNLIATDPGMLFITDGPTLPEMLDEETWEMIVDAATARMIPGFMASKMQPWYLSMILTIPPCAVQDMATGSRGLDHLIMQDAAAAGVPMQAVEPFTTLFDIFQDDPMEEQIDMLRINLLQPDVQQQMYVSLLDRYFAQDIASLWEMSRIAAASAEGLTPQEAEDLFAEAEQELLINRNRNWMPIIAEASDNHERIVLAVGAAHLIGTEGVLQFLQDDGWTLKRMN